MLYEKNSKNAEKSVKTVHLEQMNFGVEDTDEKSLIEDSSARQPHLSSPNIVNFQSIFTKNNPT